MIKVLIIDDVECATLLEPHLGPLGFAIVQECEADHGPAAVTKEEPALILLDLGWPEDRHDTVPSTGGRLHTILRREFPDIPVLIFSSRTEDAGISLELLEVEPLGRINKPDILVQGWAKAFAARLERAISAFTANTEPFASLDFHIGQTRAMRELAQALRDIAPRRHPVLLSGETGVGKRLAAQALHQLSGRAGHFVVLDQSAYEAGGEGRALADFFAEAAGGTLLLARVDDFEDRLQTTLLGLIDGLENEIEVEDTPSVRVVATTSRAIEAPIAEGGLRSDLYFRLRSCELRLPPLRERLDDLPTLFVRAVDRYNATTSIPISRHFRPETHAILANYTWPGNIREFNAAVLTAASQTLNETLLPSDFAELTNGPTPRPNPTPAAHAEAVDPIIADARASFDLIRSLPAGPARYEALKETRQAAVPLVMQFIIDDHLATTQAMIVKREEIPYYLLGSGPLSNQNVMSINAFTSKRANWKTLRKTPKAK